MCRGDAGFPLARSQRGSRNRAPGLALPRGLVVGRIDGELAGGHLTVEIARGDDPRGLADDRGPGGYVGDHERAGTDARSRPMRMLRPRGASTIAPAPM